MYNQIRYHGLDALRAFAMILGVVLHAGLFYLEDMSRELGYESKDPDQVLTSATIGWIFTFIHLWRMPVFFLLAGFFTRLMIQKRGVTNLLKNRAVRIVIPFIVGSLIYNFILFETGSLTETHHLWFLYDLILMYLLITVIKLLRRPFHGSVTEQFDRFFSSPVNMLWLLVFLIPTTVVGRPFFFNWINSHVGIPGPFFILGFSYFLIGWFFHRNTHILEQLAHRWRLYVGLGSVFFAGYSVLLFILGEVLKEDTLEAGLTYLVALILSPVATLLLILGFIGATQAIFQNGNRFVSYFVDASYWIYLFHLFVVFVIGGEIIVKQTTLSPIIGFSINIVLTTIICTITYHIFVRYTPIGWVLHGRKGNLGDLKRSFLGNKSG